MQRATSCFLILSALFLFRSIDAKAREPTQTHWGSLVTVCSSSGGPAPYLACLDINSDGAVFYGDIGPRTACSPLSKEAVLEIEEGLYQAIDVFTALSAARLGEIFADARETSFLFRKPLRPWLSDEIVVPYELFPLQLLPLSRLVDRIGTQACGKRYIPVTPKTDRYLSQ